MGLASPHESFKSREFSLAGHRRDTKEIRSEADVMRDPAVTL